MLYFKYTLDRNTAIKYSISRRINTKLSKKSTVSKVPTTIAEATAACSEGIPKLPEALKTQASSGLGCIMITLSISELSFWAKRRITKRRKTVFRLIA